MWSAGSLDLWKQHREAFQSSLYVDEFHARVGTAEMTNHRFLCEDEQVEQTEFSCGISVIANFADETRSIEGHDIAAGDYLILD